MGQTVDVRVPHPLSLGSVLMVLIEDSTGLEFEAVDKDATAAVHVCVSFTPDFCMHIIAPAEYNSKRAKGQP